MNSFRIRNLMFCLAIVLLLSVVAAAQTITKNKYHQIEVTRFEVKEGVKFPEDYLIAMTEELVVQLQEGKNFKSVLRPGETSPESNAPAIKLTGTVISFNPGNRAMRYMIGPGFGKTKIVAHVRFIDRESGAVLFEKDVDGKVILGGAIKGESIGATRGLAKEVAKVARQKFF